MDNVIYIFVPKKYGTIEISRIPRRNGGKKERSQGGEWIGSEKVIRTEVKEVIRKRVKEVLTERSLEVDKEQSATNDKGRSQKGDKGELRGEVKERR